MKPLILAMFIFLVAGCVQTHVVPDAGGVKSINTVFMSCKKPYILTQDCSNWSGAKRRIVINGFELKVSATESGKQILIMDAHLFKNSFSDILTLNSPTHSKASNQSYFYVKKILQSENISIIKAIPLRSFGNVDGYVLELDGDGYRKLIEFTKK